MKLFENGVLVDEGEPFRMSIPPQEKQTIFLKGIPSTFNANNEYILEVVMYQKKETEMIPKGHEIAWDQFIIHKKESKLKNKVMVNPWKLIRTKKLLK